MLFQPSLRAPSSGPSDHLLPAGEKKERAETSQQKSGLIIFRAAALTVGDAQRQRDLFSPAGRRWRVAPDEGAPEANAAHWADKPAREFVSTNIKKTTRGESI
ncbi:hypothetical protein C0V73_01495 [Rhizobium sp. TH135]|nr:hypothetical protein C0V73_01495 [Rhizobium sp. TH135]